MNVYWKPSPVLNVKKKKKIHFLHSALISPCKAGIMVNQILQMRRLVVGKVMKTANVHIAYWT